MASSEDEWEVEGGAFGIDGETPTDDSTQQSVRADTQAHGESDGARSVAENAVRAEQLPSKPKPNGPATTRKRGRSVVQNHSHDDDDFESQPTITKWFRQVPGPLHDVMKKQHLDLQQSLDDDSVVPSGRSSGHIVHISTVFDTGAWVDMCDALGMATSPGALYGGVKMSSLSHMLAQVLENDEPSPQIPRLLLLIKSMKYVDDEIVAVFHDPSGEIDGYFHREIVEHIGPALIKGSAVVLRHVTVFTPSDSAVGGASKRYLNITPRNVHALFPATTVAITMETIVRAFNASQAELIKAEEEAATKEGEEEAEALGNEESRPRPRVLAPADVRTTTTELSFISQRQVVQRHEPVRVVPSEAETLDGSVSGKQKKKKKANDPPSGLGQWQWHTLAQKKPPSTTNEEEEVPNDVRRHFPSGRFTELLSQHIQARRTAAATVNNPSPLTRPAEGEKNSTTVTQPASAKSVRFTSIEDDDDDDDDDW